ncbi:MAG TPA: DUF3048 C-terminal domain-containing protein, partial [Chloroflexota bacterium]
FWRVTTRAAPHNEYTSTTLLRAYADNHGGSTTGSPTTLPHKGDASPPSNPSPRSFTIQFSSADYTVQWRYDAGTNSYLRFMGGSPHNDALTGRQLRAKNVVVMDTTESAAYDPYTPGSIHLATEGQGRAVVYQDGRTVVGTWQKGSVSAPLQWLDSSGRPIPLNRGLTWVEVVPQGTPVTTP